MKIERHIFPYFAAAALLLSAACNKSGTDPEPPGPDDDYPEVGSIEVYKGTAIGERSNAIGQVTDAVTGQGIEGIPVTDGYTYVYTDKNGVYQFEKTNSNTNYCRNVYLSIPAEYEIPLDEREMPLFYSTKEFKGKKLNINDFTLKPLTRDENEWTLFAIGDPQCQNDKQVARYKDETVVDIQGTAADYRNVYCMTLGDVTFDSVNTWPGMVASMSKVRSGSTVIPFFQTIGNHDHNSKASTAYASLGEFVKNVGPVDYSFNRGKVHIVSMDDVRVTNKSSNNSPNGATWNYDAGLEDNQWKWLQRDLETVKDKQDKMIIICMHIPVRAGESSGGASFNKDKHYADLLQALRAFNEAHIMIGHTHYYQNYIHKSYQTKNGKAIYEHIHGAACGAWWACNSTVNGSPNGYTIYSIKGNTIENWKAKSTGHPADFQMRVWDGNQIYTGKKNIELKWYDPSQKASVNNVTVKGLAALKGCFVAEVWDDDDTFWKLEFIQDGAKVGDFVRVSNGQCCNVAASAYFFNELSKDTDTWASVTASHYWYFKPVSGDPSKEKNWIIKATHTIPGTTVTDVYTAGTLTTTLDVF